MILVYNLKLKSTILWTVYTRYLFTTITSIWNPQVYRCNTSFPETSALVIIRVEGGSEAVRLEETIDNRQQMGHRHIRVHSCVRARCTGRGRRSIRWKCCWICWRGALLQLLSRLAHRTGSRGTGSHAAGRRLRRIPGGGQQRWRPHRTLREKLLEWLLNTQVRRRLKVTKGAFDLKACQEKPNHKALISSAIEYWF